MAKRGRKKTPVSFSNELEKLNEEISETEERLKGLKQKRREIENALEEHEKDALYQAVKSSGKTIEEILGALENCSEDEN